MTNEPAASGVPDAEGRTPWLSGIIPPVCTPLTPDFEVDVASLERHVGFLLEGGVTGLFVLGSSGEVMNLREDQRDTVVEVAVKTAAGQVPVLAGSIDTTTIRTIEHAHRATSRGADAIVATSPFYFRFSRPEIDQHFRMISSACDVPLIAYDIPVAVSSKLDPLLVVELATDGVIQGLKDSSGDLVGMRQVIVGARGAAGFSALTGSELVVDCVMLMGADGAVPGLANVDPHGFAELYRTCRAGNWTLARAQQERLLQLFALVRADPARFGPTSAAVGGFKSALMLRGIISSNTMTRPHLTPGDDEIAAVRDILVATGLL
jgi:4-hydroxy-tetrahydrodipicolinate synthase